MWSEFSIMPVWMQESIRLERAVAEERYKIISSVNTP